ncbi:hypothetical protein H2248_011025 [Termitomyces sp. 'cryptogamus']|nr:hypothetical protein H2248_011025 [Termitomyces sp. 'cryptogamus']
MPDDARANFEAKSQPQTCDCGPYIEHISFDSHILIHALGTKDCIIPTQSNPSSVFFLVNLTNFTDAWNTWLLPSLQKQGIHACKWNLSGSADLGGSAALGESLLGGRDPLVLITKHSKMFLALMTGASSQWDVIRTDLGRSGEVGLRGNGRSWQGSGRRPYGGIRGSKGVGSGVINGSGAGV